MGRRLQVGLEEGFPGSFPGKDSLCLFPNFKQPLSFFITYEAQIFLETLRLFWEFKLAAKETLGFTEWGHLGAHEDQLLASLKFSLDSETPKPGKIKDLMTTVVSRCPSTSHMGFPRPPEVYLLRIHLLEGLNCLKMRWNMLQGVVYQGGRCEFLPHGIVCLPGVQLKMTFSVTYLSTP